MSNGTAVLRPTTPDDHAYFVRRLDDWWGGRSMAAMLPKLFFVHFADTSVVAEDRDSGERLGFLCGFLSQTDRHVAYVHFVGIDPEHRQRGLGRQLYEWFFERAGERGARTVRCVTSPVNDNSIAFHHDLGFESQEVEAHDGPGEDRVVFTRRLDASGQSSATGRLVVVTGLPGSGKTTVARELAASMPAVRMCPDDWMTEAGIDLWDARARDRIERFQFDLALDLLRTGETVVIEWGVWTRAERDALRDAARAIGAAVELRFTPAPVDELWRRIVERDREGRWGARSITRGELDEWHRRYEVPTDEELATYDPSA